LRNKPFALLGINLDRQRRALSPEEFTWRSWWDGADGAISAKWQVEYLPTLVILDGRGVIRHRPEPEEGPVSPRDLDRAIDKLIAEQENDARKSL
jgi:hypothetical protein